MASVGMNRETGRLIRDFDHVTQSIGDILTTNIAERVIREWYGFPGFSLLGEPMNRVNLVRLLQLIAIALSMRQLNGLPAEPRFRIARMVPLSTERDGNFSCRLDGEYMPLGHLGDFTPEGQRKVILSQSGSRFVAADAGSI